MHRRKSTSINPTAKASIQALYHLYYAANDLNHTELAEWALDQHYHICLLLAKIRPNDPIRAIIPDSTQKA